MSLSSSAPDFDLMTFAEVEVALRLSRNTLKKYMDAGSIPYKRFGHQYRFRRVDIEKIVLFGFPEELG